jgi:hypothetical protein
MAMETDLAIMAREAVAQLTTQQHPRGDTPPASTAASATALPVPPDEGVTLTLSAQGKLMAALATAVDQVTTAAVDSTEAAQGATASAPAAVKAMRTPRCRSPAIRSSPSRQDWSRHDAGPTRLRRPMPRCRPRPIRVA